MNMNTSGGSGGGGLGGMGGICEYLKIYG